jgi:poly(3-hydroxyalkanoate) synthetase
LITCPTCLLAGANDDITTPEQVLGAANSIGTPKDQIVRKTAPGGHIGLFMGARALKAHWPGIASWIAAQRPLARASASGQEHIHDRTQS